MGGYGYGMMGGGGFALGWFMMVLWWAFVLVVVVALVRWLAGGGRGESGFLPAPRKPLDILKERYARGDIDRETYDRMRRDLE
jgi:putative membrane protein